MGSKLGEFAGGTGTVGVLATGTAGAGATDVAVKIGTSATAHATAKLLSVCSGVGGTEVERARIDGAGNLTITGNLAAANFAGGAGSVTTVSVTTANGISGTVATATTTPAISLALGDITPNMVTTRFLTASSKSVVLNGGAGGFPTLEMACDDATPDISSTMLSAKYDITGTPVDIVNITYGGRIDQNGQNTSGTTGTITCDRPIGIHIIASGDENVTVNNALFTAGDWVLFQFIDAHKIIDIGPWADNSVTGQITFHAGTTQSGDVRFCWEIKKMLTPV